MTRDMSLYLFEMQESQRKWAVENFGVQLPIQMMMGLIGELGEFAEHYEERNDAKIVDDIGDVGVYLMNYCNLKGWRVYEDLLVNMSPANRNAEHYPYNILPFVKSLPHHQLKGDQNIRGGTEYHDDCMKRVLSNMLWQLNQVAAQTNRTFVDCLAITWSKVSKRDWVLHPDDADAVVEKQESKDV
jgi:NTP pyrophosphatase (non-canonical NTP hydrolase)